MNPRCLASMGALPVMFAVVMLTGGPVAGQAPAATTKKAAAPPRTAGQAPATATKQPAAPPRTGWGDPSLESIWSFATTTPLERPAQFKDREFLTPAEIEAQNRAANEDRAPNPGDTGTYNAFWFERGNSTGRTSLMTDPKDGRVPPFTPEGQKRNAALRAMDGTDSWENRGLSERCLTRPTLGPPIIPGNYNAYVRLVQTPGYFVISVEMPSVSRVVPMDGRPHLSPQIREWLGDSRGHWEGNTLVVETTNFTDKSNFRGSGKDMRLIERFTRVDANRLNYEFTVEDPGSFTKPWTALIPMTKTDDEIYEYACHEGNNTVVNVLYGARAQEKAAADAAKTSPR